MKIGLFQDDGSTELAQAPRAQIAVDFQNGTIKPTEIEVLKNGTVDLNNIVDRLGLGASCPIPSRIHVALAFPKSLDQK